MFKKLLAAFVAAFLCSTAFAQTAGCSMPSNPKEIRYGVTVDGAWAYWYCDTAQTVYSYRVATFDGITNDMLAKFKKCAAGDCKDSGILAAASPNVIWNNPKLRAIYSVMIHSLNDEMTKYKELMAALEGWTVSKNGSYSTRPSYTYVDGVRASTSTTTVTVGSPCDCKSVMITQAGSTSTYCQTSSGYKTSVVFVALCTRPK